MEQKAFNMLVTEVFKQFLKQFFQYEDQSTLQGSDEGKNYDNAIFISLFGDIEGGFILEVDNDTVEKFLRHIHDNLKQKIDLAQLVKGYIGEFGNILASRIVTNLGKNFGTTHLSTPSLFTGMGMSVDLFYEKSLSTVINSEFGLFKVTFSVAEF